MPKKIVLFFAGFLFLLNIFVWQEVFVLSEKPYLMVDFLDVGQGDSAFIKTPQNHHILIDGGPGSSVLQKLNEILPFWDRTIDVVLLTHPEKDHMQGLLEVLGKYHVKYFLWTGVVKVDAENRKLAVVLDKARKGGKNFLLAGLSSNENTKVMAVSAGKRIKAGNVLLDILYPFENLSGKEMKNTSNDSCIVNRLVYGSDSFLFTGDISSAAEKQLANAYELGGLKSDVLKVAHHGSKYSTSDLFLESVKPKMAVISAGKNNSYGHPTGEVLQRLEKFGIKVLRTDEDGDIKLISDGNKITIKNN